MVRGIAKPALRALILSLALGAQAPLPACFGQSVHAGNPQTGAPALPGQIVPCETIAFGTAIERELPIGEKHCFSFTLTAGKFVQAVVEQRGIDVVVRIFGEDGKLLNNVDRLNGRHSPETASLIAPGSGVYHLQIEPGPSATVRGGYRVTLKDPRDAIQPDEKRIAAEKLAYDAEQLRRKNIAEALRQAAEKYELAGSLWREVGDPYEEGIALYGAGFCHRSLGANQSAITVLRRSLELLLGAKDDVGIAIWQGVLGWSYYYLGALDRALESFEQSLQARQRIMDRVGEGQMHYGIGSVRIGRNENQLALESFKESLRLRQEAKDTTGAARTSIGLGKAYFRLERYDESRAMLEGALKTLRELKDIGGQIEALGNLGYIDVRQKDYASARDKFQEMLKLSLANEDRYGEAGARLRLAVLARRAGELGEAIDQIKRGVEIFESFRTEGADTPLIKEANHRLRIDFFTQAEESYEVYTDLLMRLDEREPGAGHVADALYVSERARARNLLDLLASAGASDAEIGHARPLRVNEIQQRLLDENTVLLEYALGTAGDAQTDRSFLWLVTSNSVESHLLPKRVEIEATAKRSEEHTSELQSLRHLV